MISYSHRAIYNHEGNDIFLVLNQYRILYPSCIGGYEVASYILSILKKLPLYIKSQTSLIALVRVNTSTNGPETDF